MIYRVIEKQPCGDERIIKYSRNYGDALALATRMVEEANSNCDYVECYGLTTYRIEELEEAYDEKTASINKLPNENENIWIPNGGLIGITDELSCDFNKAFIKAKHVYSKKYNTVCSLTDEDFLEICLLARGLLK